MSLVATLQNELRGQGLTPEAVDYTRRGFHLEVEVSRDRLCPFAEAMLGRGFYIVLVAGLHAEPEMQVVYQFAHTAEPCRVVIRVPAGADSTVPSIAGIYQGADWHERETRDMYGITFTGHPNPQPLLLAEEDADLAPLRKKEGAVKPLAALRPAPPEPPKPEVAP